jgi:hypothetical protein
VDTVPHSDNHRHFRKKNWTSKEEGKEELEFVFPQAALVDAPSFLYPNFLNLHSSSLMGKLSHSYTLSDKC